MSPSRWTSRTPSRSTTWTISWCRYEHWCGECGSVNTVKVDYMDDKLVQVWTLVWRVWGGITVIRYVVNLVRKANGCAGTSDSAPLPSGLLSEVPWHAGSPRPPRQPYPPSPLSLLPCRTPVPSPPPSAGPWVPQAPPAPFPLPSSPSPPPLQDPGPSPPHLLPSPLTGPWVPQASPVRDLQGWGVDRDCPRGHPPGH